MKLEEALLVAAQYWVCNIRKRSSETLAFSDIENIRSILCYCVTNDLISGYHDKPELRSWPYESIWQDEGKFLYALVRFLKPQVAWEIGSGHGCSAAHISAAMAYNGFGMLYTMDDNADRFLSERVNMNHVTLIRQDAIQAMPGLPKPQFVFEDGRHTYDFTLRIMQSIPPDTFVTVHDVLGIHTYEAVQKAIYDAGHFSNNIMIGDSRNGIGFFKT